MRAVLFSIELCRFVTFVAVIYVVGIMAAPGYLEDGCEVSVQVSRKGRGSESRWIFEGEGTSLRGPNRKQVIVCRHKSERQCRWMCCPTHIQSSGISGVSWGVVRNWREGCLAWEVRRQSTKSRGHALWLDGNVCLRARSSGRRPLRPRGGLSRFRLKRGWELV